MAEPIDLDSEDEDVVIIDDDDEDDGRYANYCAASCVLVPVLLFRRFPSVRQSRQAVPNSVVHSFTSIQQCVHTSQCLLLIWPSV